MLQIIWGILYPVILYFFIRDIAVSFGNMLQPIALTGMAAVVSIPVFVWIFRKDNAAAGIDENKNKISFLHCLLCMAAAIGAAVSLQSMISLAKLMPKEENVLMASGILPALLVTGILVPVMEELLFRGILYGRLRKAFGSTQAMWLSAIMFGVFHFQLIQSVYGFLMGMLFTFVYQKVGKEKNLLYPILMHSAANSFVCLFGGVAFWESQLFLIIAALIGLSALALCIRKVVDN